MKKIISILLTLLLAFTSITAFADNDSDETASEKKYGNEIKFFSDAGIFDFEFFDDDAITRKEYAVMLVKLLNAADIIGSYTDSVFSDVTSDTPDHEYIAFLKDCGIVMGNSDSTFRPDDDLKLSEAVAMIVRLLGYTTKADYTGGWTAGYTRTAVDLGLLNGVDLEMCQECMPAGPLAKMLYNALDKKLVNSYYIKGTSVTIEGSKGMTILELLGYEKGTGKVSGIENLNLYNIYDEKLESAVIEINGEKYQTFNSKPKELFGYDVEFFSKKEDGDTYPALISVSKKNSSAEEITVYDKDIKTVSSTSVTYRTDDMSKDKILKLKNPIILLNGEPAPTMKNDIVPKNGFMKLISNDGSNYDVVLIYSFETFLVKSVREETLSFKYNAKPSWETKASLDLSKLPYSVYTEEDGYTDTEGIRAGSVVMIAYGKAGCYIYPANESVMGEITSTTEKKGRTQYMINNTYYEVNPDYQALIDAKADGTEPLKLNMFTKFCFDCLGRIYGTDESSSDYEYGYLFALKANGVFDKEVQLKVLCQRSNGMGIFDVKEEVNVNGVKKPAEDAYNALTVLKNDTTKSPVFKFKVNSDNLITDVVTTTVTGYKPDEIGDDKVVLSGSSKKGVWHGSYKHFTDWGSSIGALYAGNSIAFKVDETRTDEKYYKIGKAGALLPNRDTSAEIKYAAYDVDEYGIPGLIIYYDESGGSSVKFNSDIYFVKGTYYGVLPNGNTAIGMELIDKNGTEKSILTDGETENESVCKTLKEGDYVQISLNADNVAEGVEKIFSYNITEEELDSYFNASTGKYRPRMINNGMDGGFALYTIVKGVGDTGTSKILEFEKAMNTQAERGKYNYRKLPSTKFLVYDGETTYSVSADELEKGDIIFLIGHTEFISFATVIRNAEYLGQRSIFRNGSTTNGGY